MIIEAARGVILSHGIVHASLRNIAAASGVSIGTVSYHFASISEIIIAVLEREAENVYGGAVKAADSELDPVRALVLLIDPLFSDDDRALELWRLWPEYWSAVAHRLNIGTAFDARIRVWEACVTRIIKRGVAENVFSEVDAAEVALKFAAYSNGIGVQLSQTASHLDERTARSWLLEFLDWQLGNGGAPFTGADAAIQKEKSLLAADPGPGL